MERRKWNAWWRSRAHAEFFEFLEEWTTTIDPNEFTKPVWPFGRPETQAASLEEIRERRTERLLEELCSA